MIAVAILEFDDVLQGEDWCRPLQIVSMSGGHSDTYSFQNTFGLPENNAKWVKVKSVIGPVWIGKRVGDYLGAMADLGLTWEFVRGDVPADHQLNMIGYTDISKRRTT